MRIDKELDAILIKINQRMWEAPIYSILDTKEKATEYNKNNRTNNKLGDTVVTYKIKEFESH